MLTFVATWWFWITVVIIIDLIVCEATESPIIGAVSIVTAAVMYQFVADVNWFRYLTENPLSVVLFIDGYFAVGTAWCVFKWILYSLDKRTKYREIKDGFIKLHKLHPDKPIPAELVDEWRSQFGGYLGDYPPKTRNHKKRIITWIGYWPFSMIWSVISDFVERVAKAIYNFISTFLQRISDRIFANDLIKFDEE